MNKNNRSARHGYLIALGVLYILAGALLALTPLGYSFESPGLLGQAGIPMWAVGVAGLLVGGVVVVIGIRKLKR